MKDVSIIIPTYNASKYLPRIFTALQGLQSIFDYEIIIIDSSSSDDTVPIAESLGMKTIIISKEDFNHGGTRNLALLEAKGKFLIYLTQDALPVNKMSIKHIIMPLIENGKIGMTYGRQIPYPDSNVFGSFARLFNYPNKSQIKSVCDIDTLGIKTAFASNSFAAYRKKLLEELDGFPTKTILGEDTFIAGKMLLKGYDVGYIADAQVYHSHNYTMIQEFKRYFDLGVFYNSEKWIFKNFNKAEGEGLNYVKAEILYLVKDNKVHIVPFSILRNLLKYFGYRLGMFEKRLPMFLKKKFSMHSFYWRK